MLLAATVAVAASAPHIVLAGDARHQGDEDVARPGGVLGVEPAREQDSQQVLGQEQNGFGRGWIGEGHRRDSRMIDQRLAHAHEQRVQLNAPT